MLVIIKMMIIVIIIIIIIIIVLSLPISRMLLKFKIIVKVFRKAALH